MRSGNRAGDPRNSALVVQPGQRRGPPDRRRPPLLLPVGDPAERARGSRPGGPCTSGSGCSPSTRTGPSALNAVTGRVEYLRDPPVSRSVQGQTTSRNEKGASDGAERVQGRRDVPRHDRADDRRVVTGLAGADEADAGFTE